MSRIVTEDRARIFVGCEGESENGYSAYLANLARDRQLPIAVDLYVIKEGDPLSRVKRAIERIRQQEEKRGPYQAKYALLDADQRDREPAKAEQATALALQGGMTIIWQEPDHEGLLLSHFARKEKHRPATNTESMRAL